MKISSIEIKNYRLLRSAKLDLDAKTTVIVERNNTGKTSLLLNMLKHEVKKTF